MAAVSLTLHPIAPIKLRERPHLPDEARRKPAPSVRSSCIFLPAQWCPPSSAAHAWRRPTSPKSRARYPARSSEGLVHRRCSRYVYLMGISWQIGPRNANIIVSGNLRSLNTLAKEARANYIVHTGDFGFYDDRSLDRIAEK
jgi:hypothetical protein